MKKNREEIKQRIINDAKSRANLSISWLQKKYGIGFSLAKEIYTECKQQIWENNLRYTGEAIALNLPKDRADVLLEEMNKVILNGGAQRIMLASLIATTLRLKRIQYIVTGNLSSSYLAHELKIHNVDCFKYGIRPEICHGNDYKNNYSIEFRVAPENIPKVLSFIDKKLKGNLLRESMTYKNGKRGVNYLSRYYVVDSSVRSSVEEVEVIEGGCVKYENCINNEIALESKNRDKLIRIIISGSTALSIAYECSRKIEDKLCSLGKMKKKGTVFSINRIIEDNPDLIKALINAEDSFYIPGFSSDFEYRLIKRTNPKSFNDFIKIKCVLHGTGAWEDNQEYLFNDKNRSLNLLIGSRDDVFDFAHNKGLDIKESLEIMESVRKGKGIDKRYKKIVGDEHFDILNKIKYLFPKGHIIQLIQTEILVLFFKKNYPIEFFASRLEFCNAYKMIDETLLNGDYAEIDAYIEKMQNEYSQLDSESKKYKIGVVIKDKIRIAKLLILIKKEGIKLLKPDFNKSNSNTIIIDYDNKALLLPLYTLAMPEKVAETIVIEREKKKFSSLEDLRRRTGMSASTIEELNKDHFFEFK